MAQNVQQTSDNWKAKLDEKLHEKNVLTDLLEKLETKTGVRRQYLVVGVGVFFGLYLRVGYGVAFLCNFVGFLYPAYTSIKAIESKETDDDTKWLTYCVVYSAFSLIEVFSNIFLFWIPFYSFFKFLFLLYCMIPAKGNGSVAIYNKVIKPWFYKHQKKIDKTSDKAADVAQDVLDEAEETAKEAAGKAIKKQYIGDFSKSD